MTIQEKAFTRVAVRYLRKKIKLKDIDGCYAWHPISSQIRIFNFIGGFPMDLCSNKGWNRFINVYPGLIKRLKRTATACNFRGEITIDSRLIERIEGQGKEK